MPIMHISPIHDLLSTRLTLDLGPTANAVDRIEQTAKLIKVDTDDIDSVALRVDTVSTGVIDIAADTTALKQSLTDARAEAANARQQIQSQLADAQRLLLDRADVSDKTIAKTLGTLRVDVVTDMTDLVKASADDVVKRVLAGQVPVRIEVNDKSAPLVRLLIQAQAVALDETPDDLFPKNDKKFPGWLKDDGAIVTLGQAAAKHADVLDAAPNNLKARFLLAFEKFSSNTLADRSKRFADMHSLVGEIATFLKGA